MSENLANLKKLTFYQLENFLAQIFHFEQIDSTNTFLKRYFQSERERVKDRSSLEGIGAIADLQTAGRGRLARVWHSPVGEGLYFSLLLMPRIDPINITLISLMAAIATAEAIMDTANVVVDIKWPNDILINKRKVAGILIESGFEGSNLSHVVIGIGINLKQKGFPSDLNRPATSLFLETNLLIERNKFLPVLLEKLSSWYEVLKTRSDKIRFRWQELSSFAYGKQIKVNINNQELVVTTIGLDNCGALRVETIEGKQIILYGNEITTEG
ncbi:MAG: BirA family transcriptional regulator biotin operon repressor / biotin-acetyl-CoA-carboxylase ligase [bacterium]|nr:MAG: BirA family transcriptional regulator biotin operon repressor / biotin-acetyl-CoA-carboxylase ligase [bacterium]